MIKLLQQNMTIQPYEPIGTVRYDDDDDEQNMIK